MTLLSQYADFHSANSKCNDFRLPPRRRWNLRSSELLRFV